MRTLCMFGKHWTPGRVKTRLAATIGDEAACRVYRAFIVTLAARMKHIADERRLWFTPIDKRSAFESVVGAAWQLREQGQGDLGERMADAFSAELQHPDDRCVLLGTDSPNLPVEFVEQAFVGLRSARLVLGPTEDGGYYLIAARGEPPPVFDGMPFSTPALWPATLDRLAAHGWREGDDYLVLPPWYDVDTAADLGRLRDDLRRSADTDPHLRTLAQLLDGL